MNIARVQDGRVINTEVWDSLPLENGFSFVDISNQVVSIGYFYDNLNFYKPVIVAKVRVSDNGLEEVYEFMNLPINTAEYLFIDITDKVKPTIGMIYNSETGEFYE